MELTYREAHPTDGAKLIAYLNQVGGESDNLAFGKDGITLSVEQEAAFLAGLSADPRSLMLLCFDGEEIVANATIRSSARARLAHRAEIAISVRKSHWHQGIATEMLRQLIDFARSIGVTVIELQVKSENTRAIALYRHLGFEEIGHFPRFFKIDGMYYDAELMNLYL